MISPAKSPAFEWIELLRLAELLRDSLHEENLQVPDDNVDLARFLTALLMDQDEPNCDIAATMVPAVQMLRLYFQAIGGHALFPRLPIDQPVLAAVYMLAALHGFRFPDDPPRQTILELARLLMQSQLPPTA